jgi:hypothetical protein
MITEIRHLRQAEFLDQYHLLYDRKTERECQIIKGKILVIGDGGVVIEQWVLDYYDLICFHDPKEMQ